MTLKKTTTIRYLLVSFAATLCLLGLKKDLPYVAEADEGIYVVRAAQMVATGDLNPHWFGHPGSLNLYPLAFTYLLIKTFSHFPTFASDQTFREAIESHPWTLYLVARMLSTAYYLLSILLLYEIGTKILGKPTALLGLWFLCLIPMTLEFAQIARSDTAAMFFGLLTIYLCMNLLDQPTLRNHVLAGLSLGLAVASRYFMASLFGVLLGVELALIRNSLNRNRSLLLAGAGVAAVLGAFVVTTPFFVLDFETALRWLRWESRSVHPGADGLPPLGNLWWYLAEAAPASLTIPLAVLALIGVWTLAGGRNVHGMILLGFILLYLEVISLHPLHWQRSLIPLLPIFALLAAAGAFRVSGWLSHRFKAPERLGRLAFISFIAGLSALPLSRVIVFEICQINSSTRVAARNWILGNIPQGKTIIQEAYTAPLVDAPYRLLQQYSLAASGSLENLKKLGAEYFVVSSSMYERYLAQSDRYKGFSAFYKRLFDEGVLLNEVRPSWNIRGPVIRVYMLRNNVEKSS